MSIRDMTTEDIKYLNLKKEWMRQRFEIHIGNDYAPAWIIENNGKTLCAFGAIFEWDSVCEVWFNLINKKNTISMIRMLKRFVSEKVKQFNVRRMQAIVDKESRTNVRFMIAMGFHIEGIMKKKLPEGKDAYLFAKVF